jgi:hypothetical protein
MDSLMHSVLSDTTRIKRNQAVLDSIRSGKLDPKVYNDRIKGKPLKSTSILKAQAFKKEGALEKGAIAISTGVALGATALWGLGKVVGKVFKKKPGQILNRVKAKEFKRLGKNTRSVGVNIPKIASIFDAESSNQHMYPEAARLGKIQGGATGILPGAVLTHFATEGSKNKHFRLLAAVLGGLGGMAGGAALGQRIGGGPTSEETKEMTTLKARAMNQYNKVANVKQMGSLVDTGLSAEAAAKAAYPNATPEELAGHVVAYKAKKKRGKLYVDKVVLKKAELLQKAANKVNFSKVSNAALGYRGALPGAGAIGAGAGAIAGAAKAYTGGTKQPGQVGPVPPSPTGGGGHKI